MKHNSKGGGTAHIALGLENASANSNWRLPVLQSRVVFGDATVREDEVVDHLLEFEGFACVFKI